jgi:predicted RNase H-like nuclease
VIAGADGAGERWLVALVRDGAVSWEIAPDAAAVLDYTRDCAAVGVDVPIGLPQLGRRPCDLEARRRLGRAASSVYFTPVRAVLHAATHREAGEVLRAHGEAGMTIYTWRLLPKIRQWDELPLPPWVVEVHPEVSFRAMAPGITFATKKSAPGAWQRIDALSSTVDVPAALAGAPTGVGLDDALDALAAAWSAQRFAAGIAETLGGEPDSRGRPMRIVV